jgi:predicted Zn-dependent protease
MQNGQAVRLMAYFLEYRGAVYHFLAYTSPQSFGTFENVFLRTMHGFDEIRDQRILSRQPFRIGLLPVSRTERFRDLAPRDLPKPFTLDEVAILNQVEINREVVAGTILKIPRAR